MAVQQARGVAVRATSVKRRGQSDAVLSIRLSQDELEQLQQIAERQRMSVSQLARELLLGYLRSGFGAEQPIYLLTGTTTQGSPLVVTYTALGPPISTHGTEPIRQTVGATSK